MTRRLGRQSIERDAVMLRTLIISDAQSVLLTNKSGAGRSVGEVVVQDTGNDSAFTTTTTEGNGAVIGVVAQDLAADAQGYVQDRGICSVEVDAATTRGQYLVTSTTAGKATPKSDMQVGVFAVALTAVGAAGSVTAMLLTPTNTAEGGAPGAHALVGDSHTASGLTVGHVVRASAADAFAWAQLQHSDLGGVTADLHHAEAHVLATTGPHTSTLPWADLSKTGSSLADLATRAHSNLSDAPADAHHAQIHASSHLSGGGDPVKLDDLAAPDDNTDLNASTSKHGLLLKLDNVATHFLDGQGAWTTPSGGTPAAHAASHQDGGSDEINVAGLSGQLADDQPALAHTLSGAKHTGDLIYTQLDSLVDTSAGGSASMISAATHVHTAADGSSKVTHANLLLLNADDHPQYAALAQNETVTGQWTFQADIQLDADLDFVGPQSITTTTGDVTIAPAGNVILNPTGNDILATTHRDLHFGGADKWFASGYIDELHVGTLKTVVFEATEVNVFNSSFMVAKSSAALGQAETFAANEGADTFLANETSRFAVGDFVMLKDVDSTTWLEVTGIGSDPTINVTVKSGGGESFASGCPVVNFGPSGQGLMLHTSVDISIGGVAFNGPCIGLFSHAGVPWTTCTEYGRLGNIIGWGGFTGADKWGLGLGKYAASYPNFYVDASAGVMGLRIYDTDYIKFDYAAGSPVAQIAGELEIASGGGILIGPGTKDSDLTGWYFDDTEIVGQNGDGADQVCLTSDGKITAGYATINGEGIGIALGSVLASARAYRLMDAANVSTVLGGVTTDVMHSTYLRTEEIADKTSYLYLSAVSPSGKDAEASIGASEMGGDSLTLTLYAKTGAANYATLNADLRLAYGLWVGLNMGDPPPYDIICEMGGISLGTTDDPGNGNIKMTGNITLATANATVDGVDVSALKTDVDGFPDSLKNLEATEIAELENIGPTPISAGQWGYLGGLDQALATTDSPTFANLTATKLISTELEYSGDIMIDAYNAAAWSTVSVRNTAAGYKTTLHVYDDIVAEGRIQGNPLNCQYMGTATPTGGNDGDFYIETDAKTIWVKIAGTWRYTALT